MEGDKNAAFEVLLTGGESERCFFIFWVAMFGRDEFVAMLAERFPAVAQDIDECSQGLIHLEMGALARATQRAIRDGDKRLVMEYFAFVDEVFRQANPELKNAIAVSYLEHVSFDGRRAKYMKAREMLSPSLRQELTALEEYLSKLFERGKSGSSKRNK